MKTRIMNATNHCCRLAKHTMVFLISFILCASYSGKAQIVPNGSFEDEISLPTTVSQIDSALHWQNGSEPGSPDYYHRHSPGTIVNVPRTPTHSAGFQETDVSGENAYAGIIIGEIYSPLENEFYDHWEYIGIELNEGLYPNKSYTVSYKVNVIDHTATSPFLLAPRIDIPPNGITAFLFNLENNTGAASTVRQNALPLTNHLIIPGSKQVSNQNLISDENGWTTVTKQIPTRNGGEVLDYMIIGSFLSKGDLRQAFGLTANDTLGTYVFIDDVEITENNPEACNCDDITDERKLILNDLGGGCWEIEAPLTPGCMDAIEKITVIVQGDISSANKAGQISQNLQNNTDTIRWDKDKHSGRYQFCANGSVGSVLVIFENGNGDQICRKMLRCDCNEGYEWIITPNKNTPDNQCCYDYTLRKKLNTACEIYGFGIDDEHTSSTVTSFLSPTPLLPNVGDEETLTICVDNGYPIVRLQLYDDTPEPWNGYNILCDRLHELTDCPAECCENITMNILQDANGCIDVRAIFGNESCENISNISVVNTLTQATNNVTFNPDPNGAQQLGNYCCTTGIINLMVYFMNTNGDTICHKVVNSTCESESSCCDVITPIITSLPNQRTNVVFPGVVDTVRCCWDINIPWLQGEFCEIGGWLILDPGDPVPNQTFIFLPPNSNMGTFCSDDFALDISMALGSGQSQSTTLHLNRVLAIYDVNGNLLCTEAIEDSCTVTFYGPDGGGGPFGKPGRQPKAIARQSEGANVVIDEQYFKIAPNPTDATTTIYYSLLADANVKVAVYNSTGQIVEVIEENKQTNGVHSIQYNTSQLSTGVYYIFLQTESESAILPMTVVR